MLRRFFLMLLASLAAFAAAAQEAPDALVKRTADDILTIVRQDKDLQAGNTQKVVQLAEQKVLPYFDFERMTRLAVGRSWQQATPEQRQALVAAFRTMLVRTYSSSLSQYRNQTIEVKPLKMAPNDTDVTVRTAVIQQGGPQIPIDYAMEKKDNAWKVYDVTVDGASLVTTYRGSFGEQIQKGGIDGLIKTLQERNQSGGASAAAKK
jgi:phospholipid transport system substrate-binding protein